MNEIKDKNKVQIRGIVVTCYDYVPRTTRPCTP